MGHISAKLSGRARRVLGRATNNRKMEKKGRLQETLADIRHRVRQAESSLYKKTGRVRIIILLNQ